MEKCTLNSKCDKTSEGSTLISHLFKEPLPLLQHEGRSYREGSLGAALDLVQISLGPRGSSYQNPPESHRRMPRTGLFAVDLSHPTHRNLMQLEPEVVASKKVRSPEEGKILCRQRKPLSMNSCLILV